MSTQTNSGLKFLLENSGRHKIKLIFSGFFSVVSTLLSFTPFVLFYFIIEALLRDSVNYSYIYSLVIATIILSLLRIVFQFLSGMLSHVAAFTILYQIRMKVVEKLGFLPMGFIKNHTSGNIKRIIDEDVEKLELFIAHQIPDLVAAIVTPLAIIIFLIVINWQLGIFLFIPLLLSLFFQYMMMKGYETRMGKYNDVVLRLNSALMEYINGMIVFKAFNMSARKFRRYKEVTKEYADLWEDMTIMGAKWWVYFLAVIDSSLIFIIPVGGALLLTNKITIAAFALFIVLSMTFFSSFKNLLEFGSSFQMLLQGANKINSILKQAPQYDSKMDIPIKKGEIKFNNVSFKYEDKEVLKDISFCAKANTITALVGPSGGGKTTIGQLVGRFYDIEKGSITIDGIDIKAYGYESLMKQTAFVFQDVFMLNDTIFENIKMGRDFSKEEVIEAAKKAQIHTFIDSLENKYDTMLGPNGVKLSGGEKQRIAIARAFLKNTKIVVLDEITAYSDIDNELEIQKALKILLKDKTAIIIAHKLYTISEANNIIVIDKGKIVESGTHNKLLENNNLYAKLWNIYKGENNA
ncbi:MAG: ABC transporter ATP-binding protein [Pleomorphochaeta sp.]